MVPVEQGRGWSQLDNGGGWSQFDKEEAGFSSTKQGAGPSTTRDEVGPSPTRVEAGPSSTKEGPVSFRPGRSWSYLNREEGRSYSDEGRAGPISTHALARR